MLSQYLVISVKDNIPRLHNNSFPQKRGSHSQCCYSLPQYYYRELFWASLHIFFQKNVTSQCNLHNKHITCFDQQVSLISLHSMEWIICSTASSVCVCVCVLLFTFDAGMFTLIAVYHSDLPGTFLKSCTFMMQMHTTIKT